MKQVVIKTDYNPYRFGGEGRVNQLPPVVALLRRAMERTKTKFEMPTQADVFKRLYANAPRVALISGSPDHIGHIMDEVVVYRAALEVWQQGGVPYAFGIPVMCDAVGQANLSMSYSLFTRNMAAEMVASQMEAHNYHAAIYLQGCDKTPLGGACGLAALDAARQARGHAPVWATFIPIHVLHGNVIPDDTRKALENVLARAEKKGAQEAADDLRSAMACALLCSTHSSCAGVFRRLIAMGVMKQAEADELSCQLSSASCEEMGGMCCFHGTGNSSRITTAALGLAHPAGAFLSEPPSAARVKTIVTDLFKQFNKPEFSVLNMVRANWANAVRVWSGTGGSSNLALHLVALANYAGMKCTVEDMDKLRTSPPVPDIFSYSPAERRTHYELAVQCETGKIRGIDTIYHELSKLGVPLNLDAPTSTGTTWKARLKDKKGLSASGVKKNPIVLPKPRRTHSGVDLLKSNFFDSAVVKISGMSDDQLVAFDDKVMAVYYCANEDAANQVLLDPSIVNRFEKDARITKKLLLAMLKHNAPATAKDSGWHGLNTHALYNRMVDEGIFKVLVVIAGQGPKAFGMPEMFTPMNHINFNKRLRKIAAIASDGRYSGVSYGAAIGHLTPEAADGGEILYLKHGDTVRLRLTAKRLDLIDRAALEEGKIRQHRGSLSKERAALGKKRLKVIADRKKMIALPCVHEVSDVATGVVPLNVLAAAKDKLCRT